MTRAMGWMAVAAWVLMLPLAGGLQAQPSASDFLKICVRGTAAEVAEAISAVADVNAVDEFDMTPLMVLHLDRSGAAAAKAGLLLEAGADPNLRDVSLRRTALYFAAGLGDEALVERLLAAGAEVEAKNGMGVTPLMTAAGQGRAGVVRALLAAGARVDAEDGRGGTALVWACRMSPKISDVDQKKAEVLRVLLDHGAAARPGPEGGVCSGLR